MSIKKRLILSYMGMIIIPMILIGVLNTMVINFLHENKIGGYENSDPVKAMRKATYRSGLILRQANIDYNKDKNKLKNIDYIKKFDDDLQEIYLGIAFKVDDEVIYVSDYMDKENIKKQLPGFNEFKDMSYKATYSQYLIGAQRDYLIDDSKVSLYIIIDLKSAEKSFKKMRLVTLISAVIVVWTVAFLLSYSMYKKIIKPIEKLKKATAEIAKGNLEYDIEPESDDEIGELVHNFEVMRKNLQNAKEIHQKYEKNRKNLISNISHDLKTPIMSIKGYIEGIRDGVARSPEKMSKYIHTIYDKANYMEELINELFLFSKLDLKRVDFDFRNIDVVEYLKYCVEDLVFDMQEVGGKINLTTSKEKINVTADLQKLQRVILNIVQNSIKYRDKDKLIVNINIKEKEDFVQINISDNGKGISEKNLSLIFDRFYRADESRNSLIGGSGLGLAICREIVKCHGGDIWAKSQLNKGTTVSFTIKKAD